MAAGVAWCALNAVAGLLGRMTFIGRTPKYKDREQQGAPPRASDLEQDKRLVISDPVYTCEALAAIPIHASAVRARGGALLFLGPPETGKSTVRRMLEAYLPTWADDVVYLVPQAAAAWGVAPATSEAFYGPLTASQAAELPTVPLQAVLRLYRATEPRVERIGALETCRHLTGALFETYWPQYCDVAAKRLAFSILARIAAVVAGYHLYFDRSAKTVQVLAETFQFQPE